MERLKIMQMLSEHIKRPLTDDEILIFNTAYSAGEKESFRKIITLTENELKNCV